MFTNYINKCLQITSDAIVAEGNRNNKKNCIETTFEFVGPLITLNLSICMVIFFKNEHTFVVR